MMVVRVFGLFCVRIIWFVMVICFCVGGLVLIGLSVLMSGFVF